jgi:hypothetical protein
LGIETRVTKYNKSIQILAYADDVVIVGRSIDALKETIKKLMKAAWVMGITINMPKTKYLEVTKQPTDIEILKTDSQEYERVKEFKYQGTILTDGNDIKTEIKQLIVMADNTSYGLKKH